MLFYERDPSLKILYLEYFPMYVATVYDVPIYIITELLMKHGSLLVKEYLRGDGRSLSFLN